jgi:hypothetical protein
MPYLMRVVKLEITGLARQSKAAKLIHTVESTAADSAVEIELYRSSSNPELVHASEDLGWPKVLKALHLLTNVLKQHLS